MARQKKKLTNLKINNLKNTLKRKRQISREWLKMEMQANSLAFIMIKNIQGVPEPLILLMQMKLQSQASMVPLVELAMVKTINLGDLLSERLQIKQSLLISAQRVDHQI